MSSRSRRAPVSTDRRLRKASVGGDHGPRERWQHAGRVLELTDRVGVLAARVAEEHILDILALRHIIDTPRLDAALRFKADYHAAAIASRVIGSYSGRTGARDCFSAEHERSDAEEAAYRRWRNALRLLEPRQAAVVVATVCHDMAPVPRDIIVLQHGLKALAKNYGLIR